MHVLVRMQSVWNDAHASCIGCSKARPMHDSQAVEMLDIDENATRADDMAISSYKD